MGNMNIMLFISMAAPLGMMLFIYKGKTRTSLLFLLIGISVCLFCGELNTVILQLTNFSRRYYTVNISPLLEEILKAIPIIIYAFTYKPTRQKLLESSVSVGVGFAILENAFILSQSIDTVSIILAIIRGFGAGMMHGICTLAVGFGISFINTRRKLFYTGTAALLTMAAIYHAAYNCLVQSTYQSFGFILPLMTFVPLIIILRKKDIL